MADITIDVAARTQQAQKELAKLGGSFGGLSKAAVAAGAAAGAALVGLGVAAVNNTRKLGDELQKMSIRTGIAVEDLSRLKLAAELSDVSFERLSQTSANFARRVGESLRSPTSAAAQAFAALGIDVQKADGTLLTFEEALFAVAREMEGIEDPTRRAQLAIDVFGRSGVELLPMLSEGADGLGEMMHRADELGAVMSTETAEASARLNDALTEMSAGVAGLGRRIGDYLIPMLADLAEASLRAAKFVSDSYLVLDSEGARFVTGEQMRREQALADVRAKAAELEQLKAEALEVPERMREPMFGPQIAQALEDLRKLKQAAGLVDFRDLGGVQDPGAGSAGDAGRGGRRSRVDNELQALERRLASLGLSTEQLIAQQINDGLDALRAGLDAKLLTEEEYYARRRQFLSEFAAAEEEQHALTLDRIDEESEARAAAADNRLGIARYTADALGAIGSLITSTAAAQGDARTAQQKKEAKAGFAAQQAFAAAGALVNTFLAITNALATVQPYPAAIAASVAAGIQGFAQVAAITATSIQGIADNGLMPGALRSAGLNNHTVMAVRNDEAVINPEGSRALTDMLKMERDRKIADRRGRGVSSGGVGGVYLDRDRVGDFVSGDLRNRYERGRDYTTRARAA